MIESVTTYGSDEIDNAINAIAACELTAFFDCTKCDNGIDVSVVFDCPKCGNGMEIDLPECSCGYVSPFIALEIA